MGGYGAVKIALNRPGRYEAVASLSGVLDYVGFTEMVLAGNWEDMSPQEIQSFMEKQENRRVGTYSSGKGYLSAGDLFSRNIFI